MSENQLIDVINDIRDLKDKVVDVPLIREKLTELEKKLKDLDDMQETIVETDPVRMDTRIEKLELAIKNSPPNSHLKQEISELRNALKDHSKWQKEQYSLRDMEIQELKVYIDEHIKEIHTRSHNQASKIEEVLREHYKQRIKKSDWTIKALQSPEKEKEKTMIEYVKDDLEFYKRQLEKLEKGKDGEKSVEDISVEEKVSPQQTDSTPSKPDYPECGWTEENPHCHHEKEPTEAGSARQADYIKEKGIFFSDYYYNCNIVDCPIIKASLAYEGNYYCLKHFIEIIQDDRCLIADLEFLINEIKEWKILTNTPLNLGSRTKQIKEKYLEDVKL